MTRLRTWAVVTAYFGLCGAALGCYVHGLVLDGLVAETAVHKLYKSGFRHISELANVGDDLRKVVNISLQSESAVFLLINLFFSGYFMASLMTIVVFLGRLTYRESIQMSERLIKYAAFKMVFLGALLTPDMVEIIVWLAWFVMVGYMRLFMGAARDRLEALMACPHAALAAHLRPLALVQMVVIQDLLALAGLWEMSSSTPRTKLLLCAFDLVIILVDACKAVIRYAVHWLDTLLLSYSTSSWGSGSSGLGASAAGAWSAWELKGSFLYHMELVADSLAHVLTLAHYFHVWFLHGLTFHLIDAILLMDVRAVGMSLLRRIKGYINYRTATHSLKHAYPDAYPDNDQECTICMEKCQMAKQLPCGHIFHLSCLRAWMQQSSAENFTCPNCRQPLLVRKEPDPTRGLLGLVNRLRHRMDNATRSLTYNFLHLLITGTLSSQRHHRRSPRSRPQPTAPTEGMGESQPVPHWQDYSSMAGHTWGNGDGVSDSEEEELEEEWEEGVEQRDGGPRQRDDPHPHFPGDDPLDNTSTGGDSRDLAADDDSPRPLPLFPAAAHRLPPSLPEPSTWSGDSLPRSLMAAAQRVQTSIRSSIAHEGVSAGAVVGRSRDDDDQEVISRRRARSGARRAPRSSRLDAAEIREAAEEAGPSRPAPAADLQGHTGRAMRHSSRTAAQQHLQDVQQQQGQGQGGSGGDDGLAAHRRRKSTRRTTGDDS